MAYGSGQYGGGGANFYGHPEDHKARAQMGQPTPLQQMQAYNQEHGGTMFERNLIAQEQQRRNYDSETQRQMGQQKYNVLSGLLGGTRRMG